MELYNDCVAVGINHDDYEFYWECEIGDCMEDKWRIHPSESDVGDYILNLHVYDLKLQELVSASTTVHVVPHVFAQEPTGNVQVITIGDSMSAGTDWLSYTRFLSGDKISHVGTLGVEDGLMHEGRKGIMAIIWPELFSELRRKVRLSIPHQMNLIGHTTKKAMESIPV